MPSNDSRRSTPKRSKVAVRNERIINLYAGLTPAMAARFEVCSPNVVSLVRRRAGLAPNGLTWENFDRGWGA